MEKIHKRTLGRATRLLVSMLVVALLVSIGSTEVVHGAGKRTVRVGFFPMDGYNETKADGSRTGMDVEYLDALCDYIDWNIEYVECESRDDALTMLWDAQIDRVGSAQ